MEENSFVCDECKNEVTGDSDYCPCCGSLFVENIKCLNHQTREAEGVCVICANPFCEECGEPVNSIFLCEDHCEVEIYMSAARVNYNMDQTGSQFIYEFLLKEGLHPVMNSFVGYWRDGTITVMVPFSEYIPAMKIIDDLLKQEKQ